jgi:hypothetical protein
VAFQQLYYTSCEHGLSGYSGYQFNAVTPGVPPALLREVEERTVYEPPRWLTGQDADDPEAYPVALSYTISEVTGAAVTANVVFAGSDYSGRRGNYFAHALATGAPEQDFGALLPAELWGSPLWRTTPVAGTDLPELPAPLSPGIIDRPGAQAFLDAREAGRILPELLSAVGRAMAGERPVLMVTQDVTENAWWIAAISYLLGERLARQMTFTTYSHRPGYARYHLTGTLPGAMLPETSGFQIFDLATGHTPREAVDPLAATLAGAGVLKAAGLWRQAAAFAAGSETRLDDWLGPVTVAAGLLGGQLSAAQADVVARWLAGAAGWLPPELAGIGLSVALSQQEVTLTDELLRGLLDLARRLPAAQRAEELERLLAVRAVVRITRDQPAVPVAFASPAVAAARNLAIQSLDDATPAQAVAIVRWTAASGVTLPEERLRHYGRTRLGPEIPGADMAAAVRCHPAIRRGLLERLAGETPAVTRRVLGGPAGTHLGREDLAGHPELTELWLLESVAGGRTQPMRAFDEIVDIRDAAGQSPRMDAALLHLLWPRGCPPADLAELLGTLTAPPASDVIGWFAAELAAAAAHARASDPWLRLAQALSGHPVLDLLPEQESGQVRNAMRAVLLVRRLRADGPHRPAGAFAELFGEYTAADHGTQEMLEREVPVLLAGARPLAAALRDCPRGLAAAFCQPLGDWLAADRADTGLAREVFMAGHDPAVLDQPALSGQLMTAFERVRQWSRRDLSVLAQSMGDDMALAQSFRGWRKAGRGDWPRWLPGGTGPSRQET